MFHSLVAVFWLVWNVVKQVMTQILNKFINSHRVVLYREGGDLPIGRISFGSNINKLRHLEVFVTKLEVNNSEGRFTATFETGYWYPFVGVASGFLAIWIANNPVQPVLHYYIGIICLLLSFIPLYPPAPISEVSYSHLQADTQSVTNLGIVPLGGAVLSFWPISNELIQLLLLYATCVLAAGYVARNITPAQQTEMIRFALVLVGTLPIFFTALWLAALTTIPAGANDILIAMISLAAIIGSYGSIWFSAKASRQTLQVLHETKTIPIESSWIRNGWLFLAITVISISITLLAVILIDLFAYFGLLPVQLGILTDSIAQVANLFHELPYVTVLVVLSLCAPLLLYLCLWLTHLGTTVYHRIKLMKQADPVPGDELGFTPNYQVYQTDLTKPTAISVPCWSRLETIVIIDRALVKQLDSYHIRAIYEHELYHIENAHPWVIDLHSLLAPIFGGSNGCLAYWHPAIEERAADRHAATTVGTQTMIETLRNVEKIHRQQTTSGGSQSSGGLNQIFQRYMTQYKSVKCFRALYGLYYGGISSYAAHESVDDRIVSLAEN